MVAGMGFEPHDLRVMRASIGFGFKIHRRAKTYTDTPEPTKKPTNVDGKGRGLESYTLLLETVEIVLEGHTLRILVWFNL